MRTWIVLPVTSTSTPKPIAATFKEPSPRKKSKSSKRNANQNVDVKEEGDDDDEEEEEEEDDDDEKLPPLHVFFDIEAMQPQEQHVVNLIVAETEDDDRPLRFQRPVCPRVSRMVGYPNAERHASRQRHRS